MQANRFCNRTGMLKRTSAGFYSLPTSFCIRPQYAVAGVFLFAILLGSVLPQS